MAKLIDKFFSKDKGKEMSSAVSGTEAIRTWDEHKIGLQALQEKYKTNISTGLNDEQAKSAHAQYGNNALSKKVGKPWYMILLKELTGPFSLLLWAAGIMNLVGFGISDQSDPTNLYLGIVLFLIVIFTAVFSYFQTSKSAEIMAQFENFIPPSAYVIRNSREQKIDAKYIVPGDIVVVSTGENIPCDLVIFKSTEMKVNNASLTGESEDINIDTERAPPNNIFEAKNVGFFGTQCTAGSGMGICIRIGDQTVIGQIANLAASAEPAQTPISREIHGFTVFISIIAVVCGVILLIFCILQNYKWIDAISNAIGIIVGNVPTGLLASVTIIMALSAETLAKKMVLIKNLESVETLGATSCVCSDKTGTLTQNRMTVSMMYYNRLTVNCQTNYQTFLRNKEKPNSDEIVLGYDLDDPAFIQIVKAIILGTYTVFNFDPSDDQVKQLYARLKKVSVNSLENQIIPESDMIECKKRLIVAEKSLLNIQRKCKGDASETGLVQFVQSIMDIEQIREQFPTYVYQNEGNNSKIECQIPFSSDIKFNLFVRDMSQNDDPNNKDLCIFIKGAPERILNRCSKILVDGKEMPFDKSCRDEVNQANASFGKQGERVLAFAMCKLDPKKYKKGEYKFDLKNWKDWGLDPSKTQQDYANIEGSFPLHELTLVGLVSLNDPPRKNVDMAVQKCRDAGIKVIMVTGDQPPTAAAIAHKVNILKHPQKEYNYMVNDLKIDREKAWEQCTGIVVHGDLLAEKHLAEQNLPDDDPTKGLFLKEWISKPEVVFARTTPSQKLLIVDACQKVGNIVAVTGDGVNDSPAIKKADIGIAMGSGSDVAKNAADMILLDDNFCSIVNGIEQGRLSFDNLKKSITYTITHNIVETFPFIILILVQIPLPLSAVFCIFIDLGTDFVPSIAFSYENPELDLMQRSPRNTQRDQLTNRKNFFMAYFLVGLNEVSACMFTYFLILNDYGIRPNQIWNMTIVTAPMVNSWDVYNEQQSEVFQYPNGTLSLYGNTNYNVSQSDPGNSQLAWDKYTHGKVDIRLYYAYPCNNGQQSCRTPEAWTKCRWESNDESIPLFYRKSYMTNWYPTCYTTEALKFAQSGYFASSTACQWARYLIYKSRTISLAQQQMINVVGNRALIYETCLLIFLIYCPGINIAIGTRQLAFPHFLIPAWSHFICIFMFDEMRKIWVREGIVKENNRQKYKGWIAQNTFY